MPEFVENDAGFVVPYLDIGAMANTVIKLVKDEVEEVNGDKVSDEAEISEPKWTINPDEFTDSNNIATLSLNLIEIESPISAK